MRQTRMYTVPTRTQRPLVPIKSKHGFTPQDLKGIIKGFYAVKKLEDLDNLYESGLLVYIGNTLEELYADVIKESPVPITPDEFVKLYTEQEGWDTFIGRYIILSDGAYFINMPDDIETLKP